MVKKFYTVSDGLPSNRIYKCLQDEKGFLWLATENGLSRFDGQNFRNYTVTDGLPDSDILDIFMDSSHRLWIIPFNRNPAYLDLNDYKIYNSSQKPELLKIQAKVALMGNALPNGDVAFFEYNKRFHIVRGDSVKSIDVNTKEDAVYIKQVPDGNIVVSLGSLSFYKDGKKVLTKKAKFNNILFHRVVEKGEYLFLPRQDAKIQVLKNLDKNLDPELYQIQLPSHVWGIAPVNDYVGAMGADGNLYLISPKTLQVVKTISIGEMYKFMAVDKSGAYWLCTDDNGLLKMFQPIVQSITSKSKNKSVSAIHADSGGVVTINNSGEVEDVLGSHTYLYKLETPKDKFNPVLPKKIFNYKEGHCFITYKGIFIGNKGNYKYYAGYQGFKEGAMLGDTALLLGTFRSLNLFNLKTKKLDTLYMRKRCTSVAVSPDGKFYFGSNDGLYKLQNGYPQYYGKANPILTNNVTSLLITPDSLIWVGLSIDTMVVLKNEKIISKIPLREYFHGSVCRALASSNKNTIWVGTEKSLGRIRYSLNGNDLKFGYDYFNSSDGLGEGQVNNITVFGDTVFAATNTGYSKMHVDARATINEISVYITKVMVNLQDVGLKNHYELEPSMNNLQINFAAVDLSEYKPRFEYSVNNDSWLPISGNSLYLSGLTDGEHHIVIRAIKRDNIPSLNTAEISLHIKKPLIKRIMFWIAIAAFIAGIFLFVYFRISIAKERARYAQQLALDEQRQKITADLHDDIGASLSSLQLNSAIASRLIDNDAGKAKSVLYKLEKQSRQLAERIGDIIWSLKPGSEQLMTLSSRVKNFANEILGDSEINYIINIDEKLNEVVKDFATRKNIVLVSKEAINNAAKYSHAKNLSILIKLETGRLVLKITDDGIGFDETQQKGNGLYNMLKRVEELNGSFDISSAKGKGTVITATIPVVP